MTATASAWHDCSAITIHGAKTRRHRLTPTPRARGQQERPRVFRSVAPANSRGHTLPSQKPLRLLRFLRVPEQLSTGPSLQTTKSKHEPHADDSTVCPRLAPSPPALGSSLCTGCGDWRWPGDTYDTPWPQTCSLPPSAEVATARHSSPSLRSQPPARLARPALS